MKQVPEKRAPASRGEPSRAGLVSVTWFPKPAPRAHGGAAGTLVRMAVGAAAGGVLFKLGHTKIAIVAWSVTFVIGTVSLVSPRARDALASALAKFGRATGNAVGTLLLTLVYFLALTPARFVKRLLGEDDLRLRDERLPSYYEPCDAEERKTRYARSMFATEVLRPSRGGAKLALFTAAVMITLAEVILRAQGFGPGAVLYTSDARAGYYPAPNQKLDRYGGRVFVNAFGMRAPDFAEKKPEGTFRVLMLGDSTLWGGSYIDQDQLYARILERTLNEAASGDKVEVLNMGVNGWGPFHERGFVEAFGTFGADLVLICMPHDDVDRDKYTLMSLPYFAEGHAPVMALEEVMMHGMWRYRRGRVSLTSTWREKQRELGLREYDSLGALLKDGGSNDPVAEPPRTTKAGGAEVFFEILPSKTVGLGGEPDEVERDVVTRLTKSLAARGIAAHYPAGLFAGKGKPEDLYHDEVHLHWKGHAVYADFLLDRISKTSVRFEQWRTEQRAKKAR